MNFPLKTIFKLSEEDMEQRYAMSLSVNDWNLILDSLTRTECLAVELKNRIISEVQSQEKIIEDSKKQMEKEKGKEQKNAK